MKIINDTKKGDIILMFKYFTRLKSKHKSTIFADVYKCLSEGFHINKKTIKSIVKSMKSKKRHNPNTQTKPLNIHKPKYGPEKKIDDFDRDVIRRTIYDFYRKSELPTIAKLQVRLKELDIDICAPVLSATLKELGFRWKKVTKPEKYALKGEK